MSGDVLISDTECYPNFWSIGFYRPSDGRLKVFEHSVRKPITERELDQIRRIMAQNQIVGYNFLNYDAPMIAALLAGRDNRTLKLANDRIIVGNMKPWFADKPWAEGGLGVTVPRWDIVDLMEPQPNAFASLKALAGRMHAPKMQDLPYDPDKPLTEEEMDMVLSYMGNDLDVTARLWFNLEEPLALRAAIGAEYGINVMSKSDAQVGEAIIKKRVEQARGERVFRDDNPPQDFKYSVPQWLNYERDDLRTMLERLRETTFEVQYNGKVELPDWLAAQKIAIGSSVYKMGIGGLHSTESNRSILSDDENVLIDFDVASYYPAIIINSGLYPIALGPQFLVEYRKIRDERVVAKAEVKRLDKLEKQRPLTPEEVHQRAAAKAKEAGLKIALNGCFGKLGSIYSVLYAPHLMIYTTLTGQLALLMLIERAERAGIPVVSGNTDGVVFYCPRDRQDDLRAITRQWEADTAFVLEDTEYTALYNQSVNSYIAVKPDGTAKWKGPVANPWRDGDGFKADIRSQLMKNPQMPIVANAVVDLILKGTPLEQTIRASQDVRDFVTVVAVQGGGTWRGGYLGKTVRYIWSTDGTEILKAKPHATTGNYAKVSKSDGCRPVMELPEQLPSDIDYAAYVRAAEDVLMDIGFVERPRVVKPLRVFKHSAILHWAIAV